MPADQAEILRQTVVSRANILVAGGTSTGKTTLTNALLAEVAKGADRAVVNEDKRNEELYSTENRPFSRCHSAPIVRHEPWDRMSVPAQNGNQVVLLSFRPCFDAELAQPT